MGKKQMIIDELFSYWNYYINPELQAVVGIVLILTVIIWHLESHDHNIEEKEKEEKPEIIPGVPAEPERELY